MTAQDIYDTWRVCNIFLAITALVVNAFKMSSIWRPMDVDARVGFLAVMAWASCYVVATLIAASQGVRAGIYSCIMGIPIMWTLIAGLIGRFGLISRAHNVSRDR